MLRAYLGFAEYLTSLGADAHALDLDALIDRFAQYRRGEHLAGGTRGPNCFLRIPAGFPDGWWQVRTGTSRVQEDASVLIVDSLLQMLSELNEETTSK